MDVILIVYYLGYLSTVTILMLLPLFVYSIYTYRDHPIAKFARTPRGKFRLMITFGLLRSLVALLLGIDYLRLANQFPRNPSQEFKATILAILETIMAAFTLYVGIYIPVVTARKEAEERASYYVRKRHEHRKRYHVYSQEKEINESE